MFELEVFLLLFAFLPLPFLIYYLFLSDGKKYPTIVEFEDEAFYVDEPSKKKMKFPSITEGPTRTLSVIVPAYNEEERLPPMLDECLQYLESRCKKNGFTYEVIIVDDGSKDRTTQIGLKYSAKFSSDKVRVLTLSKNRGKGGAVRLGMFRARGKFLLFADADGATKFSDYLKLEELMLTICEGTEDKSEALGIVCGSRAHMEEESIASRSLFRTILMKGFHMVVYILTVRNVRDTQCGFKLLTRRTARLVFNSLHVERWAFDVEMLFIAQSLDIPIDEVPVNWTEIDGSKVTPVVSWIQMGIDIFMIWLRYTTGSWRIKGDMLRT